MKKYIVCLCLMLHVGLLQAQTDSFEVKQKKFMKTYNFITMANKEETSILKLKVIPLLLNGVSNKVAITYDGVPIIISYERKIFPFLSYQIESKNILYSEKDYYDNSVMDFFTTYEKNQHDSLGTFYGPYARSAHKKMIFNSSIAAELRYYYNARRHMHRRHTKNNFSGNYIAFRASRNVLQTGYDYWDIRRKEENPFSDHNTHPFYDNNLSLFYGAQRRFLKYFYIDMHVGVSYRYGAEKNKPQEWRSFEPGGGIETVYYSTKMDNIARWVPSVSLRFGFAY